MPRADWHHWAERVPPSRKLSRLPGAGSDVLKVPCSSLACEVLTQGLRDTKRSCSLLWTLAELNPLQYSAGRSRHASAPRLVPPRPQGSGTADQAGPATSSKFVQSATRRPRRADSHARRRIEREGLWNSGPEHSHSEPETESHRTRVPRANARTPPHNQDCNACAQSHHHNATPAPESRSNPRSHLPGRAGDDEAKARVREVQKE